MERTIGPCCLARRCWVVACCLLLFAPCISACGFLETSSLLCGGMNVCAANLLASGRSQNSCLSLHGLAESDTTEISKLSEDQLSITLEDKESRVPGSESIYEVIAIPGKGLGVIATVTIPRGTKIIIEAPLISVPMPTMVPGQGFPIADMLSDINTSFSSLPSSSQEEFLSLHDHRFPGDETENQSHLLTIFRSNAYNTGTDHVGLFPKIARINHSCRPNSINYWSEKTQKRIIYAGVEIAKGEEITVSYIPLLKSTKERQQRLAQYGFVCGCEACRSKENGKMRGKIADLMEVLEQKVVQESGKREVNERLARRAEKLVGMVREEGLVDYLARCYRLVAVFEERRGNVLGAWEWAERQVGELRLAEEDSDEVVVARAFLEELDRKR